ncbi:leucine-rich repeat containing protein [Entamoeba histolytica HM-1:IMSS-B]|uniref:Leucine-rich repeat containing protein n=3 Tax=Entamoeba histolytica TaxID=5759 RepID=A0A175JGI2_ENTHI|nr:leucine-rich repeat containing protein [Entamoeba histolytica HM-1:IMSS-B]ENY62981.1 Leucine-rich repeat containing protein [Entamoeba histolytica HM-1:IMSS-A]GAT92588.1 leucine-rich repeat containing protein [Entamoeba histolytica]
MERNKKQHFEDVIEYSLRTLNGRNKVRLSPALAMMLNGMSQNEYGDIEKVKNMLEGLHAVKIYNEEEVNEEEDVDADDVEAPIPLDFTNKCELDYLGVKNVLCGVDLNHSDIHNNLIKLSFCGVFVESVAKTMGLNGEEKKVWSNLKILKLQKCQLTELEEVFTKENFPELRLLDVSHNHIKKIKRIGERPLDVLHADYNEIRVVSCRQVRNLSVITLDNNRIKNLNGLKRLYNLRVLSVKNNLIDRQPNTFQVFNKMFNIEQIFLEGNPTAEMANYKIEMAKVIPSLQYGMDCYLDSKPFTMEEKVQAFAENSNNINEVMFDDGDDFDFSQFDDRKNRTLTMSQRSDAFNAAKNIRQKKVQQLDRSTSMEGLVVSKEQIELDQQRIDNQNYILSKLNILKKKSSEDPAKVIDADKFIRRIRRIVEGIEDPKTTERYLEEERKRKELEKELEKEKEEKEEKAKKGKELGWTGQAIKKNQEDKASFLSKEKVIEIRFDDYDSLIPVPILYDIIRTAIDHKRTIKIKFLSAKKKWDGIVNMTVPLDFPSCFDFLQFTNYTLKSIVSAEQDKTDFIPQCDIDKEDPQLKQILNPPSEIKRTMIRKVVGLNKKFKSNQSTINVNEKLQVMTLMLAGEDNEPDKLNELNTLLKEMN